MPKGLKETSSTVSIGFLVSETAPNTFIEGSVDLNLSPLDREVFVVQGIDLNPTAPDAIAGVDTATSCSLTTTSQTSVQTLANSNCMADSVLNIRASGFVDGGVGFARIAQEAPATLLEYIGIIATNDFFIQLRGSSNNLAKAVTGKLYGYRARADADIYSALVQSEVLSA